MGRLVGKLHNIGIVHGDLTTSNMIFLLKDNEKSNNNTYDLVLIDFGLAKSTFSVEEQAVDLYVLERALQSTHPDLPPNFLDLLLEAYSKTTTTTATANASKNSQTTLQRLEQVRMRGRKRECFG
jgi:TP53 regulating kinase-like protein